MMPPKMSQEDKLQTLLLKFGSSPKQSVRWFVAGLMCFLIGLIAIYLGPVIHIWLQLAGLIFMAVALLLAARGYIGILANRLAFFRHNAAKNKAKYKHIK